MKIKQNIDLNVIKYYTSMYVKMYNISIDVLKFFQ